MEERRFTDGKVEVRSEEGKPSKIRGYAAVFNSMSQNLGGFQERILPEAFDHIMESNQDVAGLFNHDTGIILGRRSSGTLALSVDEVGFRYEIEAPDTQQARDLMVSIDRGDVVGSSFMFNKREDRWLEEDGREIRELISIERVRDVGPVTFPAYLETTTQARSILAGAGINQEKLARAIEARNQEFIQADY